MILQTRLPDRQEENKILREKAEKIGEQGLSRPKKADEQLKLDKASIHPLFLRGGGPKMRGAKW